MIVSSYLKEFEHSVKEVSAYRKYKKRFKNKDSSSIKGKRFVLVFQCKLNNY